MILLATFAFESDYPIPYSVVSSPIISMPVWIVVILYKTHISLKRQDPLVPSPLELGLPIRIVIFGAYVVIGTWSVFVLTIPQSMHTYHSQT